MMEEINLGKEFLGITRDLAIAEVADWSFVRIALKGLSKQKKPVPEELP